ncbi:unnamed protein product [Symbiodinium necroappetens]|uniref:Uncharacterized protein n=1 Tax=Symbiodinium necroappetens TaxID=1628268 RepID=A0A812ZJJ8_9DINO|nr:unnamed protein product [Symbiodinium necroappetens]
MVTKFTKEKDKDREKTSPSGSSDSSESGKTEKPEAARRDKDKSSDVEEVPSAKESKRRERQERRDRKERCEREERRARSEPRKERREREERRDRSRSHRKQRRGRSPELRAEPADNRKPAHPKGAPKDRGGSKEGSKSKERCPICWQPVSVHQSGKDQHMWSNLVCLTWQMHAAQKPHQKDWSLAKRQAQELKEHRMKKTAEPGAVLVSQATRQAAQKAQDSAAAFLRGKSMASREERTRSGSCSPAKRPTRKFRHAYRHYKTKHQRARSLKRPREEVVRHLGFAATTGVKSEATCSLDST